MRTALTVAPRDPEVMTIMAFAHERAGDRGLMGERLALAVELSNRAPAESLRYASFLMQEDRPGPAEGVVVDALRRDPENRELLDMLGRIHLAREDWARAGQVAGILRAQGDPVATAMATSLDAARLRGEGKPAAAAAMLETLARQRRRGRRSAATEAIGGQALAGLVRARLAAGERGRGPPRRRGGARRRSRRASRPASSSPASTRSKAGPTRPRRCYRTLVAEAPALPEPHRALFRLLAGEGDLAGADAALEQGIAATGDANGELLFLRAGLRESRGRPRRGDRRLRDPLRPLERQPGPRQQPREPSDGARAPMPLPSSAPMPSPGGCAAATCRSSRTPTAGSSSCAATPPRRGSYLAQAAAALPGNAQVQFHLGEAERALGNRDAAAAAYAAALAAAEAGSPLPQAGTARARASELAAPAPATPPSDG